VRLCEKDEDLRARVARRRFDKTEEKYTNIRRMR
jgi:hypothetical protein